MENSYAKLPCKNIVRRFGRSAAITAVSSRHVHEIASTSGKRFPLSPSVDCTFADGVTSLLQKP